MQLNFLKFLSFCWNQVLLFMWWRIATRCKLDSIEKESSVSVYFIITNDFHWCSLKPHWSIDWRNESNHYCNAMPIGMTATNVHLHMQFSMQLLLLNHVSAVILIVFKCIIFISYHWFSGIARSWFRSSVDSFGCRCIIAFEFDRRSRYITTRRCNKRRNQATFIVIAWSVECIVDIVADARIS